MAVLWDKLSISGSGLFFTVLALGLIAYLIYTAAALVRKPARLRQLLRFLLTLAVLGSGIYAGFCLLWGLCYYNDSFSEISGLDPQPVSVEELSTVTRWFIHRTNELGEQISRDENMLFAADTDELLYRSRSIYRTAEELFPFLEGPEVQVKSFPYPLALSYLDFSGFFFPFTGEAQVNVDAPVCLIPASAAHEIAHQRGIPLEDESNFLAVLSCLSSGDPEYGYSGSLLASIHLLNALYRADRECWKEEYSALSEHVQADLRANNAYWKGFRTKVAESSNAAYNSFLRSYGEKRGRESYGACVDLLVTWYYEEAALWCADQDDLPVQ